MSPLFFCTLIFMLCILPTHASWLPRVSWHLVLRSESLTSHKGVGTVPEGSSSSVLANTTTPYVFSVPSASIIAPTPTSQGMMVTSIVPVYEVCDLAGKNTTSCSTVFETITTESCSTVLTYAFTKTTISDCVHNVTFSSRTTYALATTSLSEVPALPPRDALSTASSPTAITYVQSTVSLFAAPWQSLAADTPGGITVLVCTSDVTGSQTCVLLEEIWVTHTEYVPITTTSTLSVSTSFSTDVVLLLGPTQSLVASAGNFTLSTLVEYSTLSPNATTSTVVVPLTGTASIVDPASASRTSTTTSTRTVTTTGDPATITMTLSMVGKVEEPTTTLTSTTTLTRTVTVQRMPNQ